MTLKELFRKRRNLYYKELLKYSRYIFNDHFSLVLIFLIGASGYAYSNYLENLIAGDLVSRVVLFILFLLLTMNTSLTLLVEAADQVFLLAKEEEFYSILKKASLMNYLQSLIPTGIIVFISYPILLLTMETSFFEALLVFLSLAALKWLNFMVKLYPYFYYDDETHQKYLGLSWIVTMISLFVLLFINIKISSFILFFAAIFIFYLFINGKIYFNHRLKWNQMIQLEENRRNKLYRFIAVFVDIPQVDSGVKRLAFLDRLFDQLTRQYSKAPYFYSLRMVVRNTEYRSLILRLYLLAVFFLFISSSYLLSLLFSVLFIYLLGFQLISLVQLNKNLIQFRIYPITEQEKMDSGLYLIHQILILLAIIMGITATINLAWRGLSFFPIGFLMAYLFSYYYVPYRLRTNEDVR